MMRNKSKHSSCELSCWIVLAAAAVTFSTGCVDAIRRGQSPDNGLVGISDRSTNTRFIGDVCGVKGLKPAQVEGIGLVVGLEGTGSKPRPSGQKDYLLRELKANKIMENAKEALSSPNTSMVLVRGFIPPAAKKGDVFDLEVVVPPKSGTKSLMYGELLKSDLRPMALMNRSVKTGNVVGRASGYVLVDSIFESDTDKESQLNGRILGGGIVRDDRELSLVVHTKEPSVKITRAISQAINERYELFTENRRENVAHPLTDRVVQIKVPNDYEHNLGRFIQSLQAMAYGESTNDRVNRLQELEKRVSNAATARRAAIELEALGDEAIPTLKRAMNHPDFEIRFYVAETLAYMGRTEGVEHLKLAAETEPAFRWHALAALASVKNAKGTAALKELLDAESAETRYGAFRALWTINPNDSRISGKFLGDEFHYHDVDSNGTALVHFAQTKRPEIVVFGSNRVSEDFLFVQTGLTARSIDRNRVRIIKYDSDQGEIRLTCSSSIGELIKTLSKFGVDYSTLLEVCREADVNGTLNARLVVNAAPRIGSKSMKDSVRRGNEVSEKYITTGVPELFSDVSDSEELEEVQ